jgi:hypothetical protein
MARAFSPGQRIPSTEEDSMRKVVTRLAVAAVFLITAAPVAAFQCPKLVAAIEAETGNRLDSGAASARELAAEAKALHAAGKHQESETKAIQGLALVGKKAEATKK